METNPKGEEILALAQNLFDAQRRSYIDVPEWKRADGTPVRIWYDPVTMAEYFELMEWRKGDGEHYKFAHTVVIKALDEAGNRLFTADAEMALIRAVSPTAVMRIANIILGNMLNPAHLEGNSKAIPSG